MEQQVFEVDTFGRAQLTALEQAVAFARGVPGLMLPAPTEAESVHAVELLRYAGSIVDCADARPA